MFPPLCKAHSRSDTPAFAAIRKIARWERSY